MRRRATVLKKVFGNGVDEARTQEIGQSMFIEKWRETFSLLPTRWEREALKEAKVEGLGHLQEALQRGKGAILWENTSFGQRLVAPQILSANGYNIVQIHGANHTGEFIQRTRTWVEKHLIFRFFEWGERVFAKDVLYLKVAPLLPFTRELHNRLTRNAILCIAADGSWGQRRLKLELLGYDRYLSTGMLSLSKMTGAPLLPMFCISTGAEQTSLFIEPPIVVEKRGDREETLTVAGEKYLSLWESYIRKYPEQFRGWDLFDRYDES